MWNWIKNLNKLWATIGAIVAVFSLGSGTMIVMVDRFDPKGESHEAAGNVHRRVDDLASRFTNFSTWVREQIAELRGRQDAGSREVAEQYRSLNTRIDQQSFQITEQNRLLVEVLKEVKANRDDTGDAGGGWSLIDSARAATRRATKN